MGIKVAINKIRNEIMDINKLTIVICSNRIENLLNYSLPSLIKVKNLYSIRIFLEGQTDLNAYQLSIHFEDFADFKIINFEIPQGHSNLRNKAIEYCITPYLLFLDDDISFEASIFKVIIEKLDNKTAVVGLRIIPSDDVNLKKWYISSYQHHYLAIHSILTMTSIWGACMAFNIKIIRNHNLIFNNKLGRQKGNFLSGEDTSLIKELVDFGYKSELVFSTSVIHHIDKTRLHFRPFIKRIFWQGVTEAARFNILKGTIKEVKRNLSTSKIQNVFLGIFWLFIFFVGCIYGRFNRN